MKKLILLLCLAMAGCTTVPAVDGQGAAALCVKVETLTTTTTTVYIGQSASAVVIKGDDCSAIMQPVPKGAML